MSPTRTITLAAAVALWTIPAWAHAFLKTSTPAVGSTLSQSPSQIEINFTEGVVPKFSSIALENAKGTKIPTGAPHLVGGDTHLAVSVHALPPGTYTVVWHATATDTHKTEGKFNFTLASQ